MKQKIWKKCPRCHEKNYIANKKCENCGLVFSRLEFTSSKKAKEAIIKREKEKIIKVTDFPKDLSRTKALIYCGLFGIIGIHNIYVKRYFKGFFSLFFVLLTAILIAILDSAVVAKIYETFLFIPGGLVFFFWFYDFVMLACKKYKVPVALDLPMPDVKQDEKGEKDAK